MGRMKIGIAVAGVVAVLSGVAAVTAMQSGDRSGHAGTVASVGAPKNLAPVDAATAPTGPGTQPASTPAKAPPTTAKAATGKAGAVVTVPANPTPEDVQKVIAGITAEVLAPSGTSAGTKPLTREEVEARVREQLKKLGINF